MAELIHKPSNIYEALLLELVPFITRAFSNASIDIDNNLDYHDYTDTKYDLIQMKGIRALSVKTLNRHLLDYFNHIIMRIHESPEGISIDQGYGVPMHKVFECLVAAEYGGRVVGGANDHGVDVRGCDKEIIQCKAGTSHSKYAKKIYKRLLKSCTEEGSKEGILAVTAENFPRIDQYNEVNDDAMAKDISIRLDIWTEDRMANDEAEQKSDLFEELGRNLKTLSSFLKQVQASVGRSRQTSWDGILGQCIQFLASVPSRVQDSSDSIDENLQQLENNYDDSDSMEPWEKSYIEGANGSYSSHDSANSSSSTSNNTSSDDNTDSDTTADDE